MTFGLTPNGFNAMRLADIKQSLEDAFIAEFGDINLAPQSVFGQEIGVVSKAYADFWENLNDVYLSQYPNSASGVSLDNVCQLNGITRLPATQTSAEASCSGIEGTFIPANSLARIVSTNESFYAETGGTITRQNADQVQVAVDLVTTQPYTVVISSETYTYSLPTITFSNVGDIFVVGNIITVTLNGITLAPIPFNVDSDTTLGDIATAIAAFTGVASATPTTPDTIDIVPDTGYNIAVQIPIQITGGATQASSVVTFRAPIDEDEITAALTDIINSNSPVYIATDDMDGHFTVTAPPSSPFSLSAGANLSISYLSSPILFLAVNYGPVPCPQNALDTIVTPISGWSTINNRIAGNLGRFIETDAELRVRRANSLRLAGAATVEAIRARLLQQVSGVTSAVVYENVTLTQEDIVIVFPDPFDTLDVISVDYDATGTLTVPYNTSQVQTMNDLGAAFQTIPSVNSYTVGGTGNQTLTLIMNPANVLYVNSVITDVSAQTAIITGGRPPKSFEAVVEGGTDQDVADKIWETKPAGIETWGNTSAVVIDSQGDSHTIYFSRPTGVFIWVQVALTLYTEETFPVNGVDLVKQAIFEYGQSLGVGIDVLFQRVLAQIFQVTGIASGNMTIAATALPTDIPSYGTADIPISDIQISEFDLERIFVTVV